MILLYGLLEILVQLIGKKRKGFMLSNQLQQHMSGQSCAIHAYFGGQSSDTQLFDEKQRDEIRAIVREEMAAAPLSVGSLLKLLGQAPQTEPISENNEPNDDEAGGQVHAGTA